MSLFKLKPGQEKFSREELEKKVILIISTETGYVSDQISLDARFGPNGIDIDSLEAVEITMGIEEEFGIDVDDDEMQKCLTVKMVVDLVERALK